MSPLDGLIIPPASPKSAERTAAADRSSAAAAEDRAAWDDTYRATRSAGTKETADTANESKSTNTTETPTSTARQQADGSETTTDAQANTAERGAETDAPKSAAKPTDADIDGAAVDQLTDSDSALLKDAPSKIANGQALNAGESDASRLPSGDATAIEAGKDGKDQAGDLTKLTATDQKPIARPTSAEAAADAVTKPVVTAEAAPIAVTTAEERANALSKTPGVEARQVTPGTAAGLQVQRPEQKTAAPIAEQAQAKDKSATATDARIETTAGLTADGEKRPATPVSQSATPAQAKLAGDAPTQHAPLFAETPNQSVATGREKAAGGNPASLITKLGQLAAVTDEANGKVTSSTANTEGELTLGTRPTETAATLATTRPAQLNGLAPTLRLEPFQQVADAIRVQTVDSKVTVRLDPPDLGSVTIDLSFDKGRSVVAMLSAEQGDTQSLLRRHQEQLMQELKAAGFEDINIGFEAFDDRSAEQFTPWANGQLPGTISSLATAASPETLGLQSLRPLDQMLTDGIDLRL